MVGKFFFFARKLENSTTKLLACYFIGDMSDSNCFRWFSCYAGSIHWC